MAQKPIDELLSDFPREATLAQMAALLKMNERNARSLVDRKILVPAKGKIGAKQAYQVLPSLWNYHSSLRDAAKGRASDDGSLASSRANLTDLQAQEAKIRIARALGEYVSLELVGEGWSKIAQVVRSSLMGLTSQIAFKVPHMTPHDRVEVGALIRETLSNISEEVASLAVLGSPGGAEFTTDGAPKAKPKLTEVKIPSNRGRPQGARDKAKRAPPRRPK